MLDMNERQASAGPRSRAVPAPESQLWRRNSPGRGPGETEQIESSLLFSKWESLYLAYRRANSQVTSTCLA